MILPQTGVGEFLLPSSGIPIPKVAFSTTPHLEGCSLNNIYNHAQTHAIPLQLPLQPLPLLQLLQLLLLPPPSPDSLASDLWPLTLQACRLQPPWLLGRLSRMVP